MAISPLLWETFADMRFSSTNIDVADLRIPPYSTHMWSKKQRNILFIFSVAIVKQTEAFNEK